MDTNNVFEGTIYISGEIWFDFLVRLLANIISTFVLIRFIYYPSNSRVKYLFTFFLMGMMIFLIASVLDQVKIEIGLALGLFAIFGIIRYRSPSIDLKEMTYLFLVIGISIINALVDFNIADWFGLLVANFIVLSAAFFMELYKPKGYVLKRSLVFTPTDYAVLNSNKLLLVEVKNNTGINILRVEIEKINHARNEVTVWIYFRENDVYKVPEAPDNSDQANASEET
ncbi:MAG: DUF4956 domain-containing protein [Bacteroidota bacterium]